MKRSFSVFIGAVASAALLAGCNNNNQNNPTIPTPGPVCNKPSVFEVLYPKNGAGSIPPTVAGVWVAVPATSAFPSGNQFNLVYNTSTSSTPQNTVNPYGAPVNASGSGFFHVSPSTIPNPHANPSFANPTYYETLFPSPIGPLVTVNLYWNDFGTSCTPGVVVGSFTTR